MISFHVGIVVGEMGSTGTSRYAEALFNACRENTNLEISLLEMDFKNNRVVQYKDELERNIFSIGITLPHKYLFYSYAIHRFPKTDLLHFTTQNLSYLAGSTSLITCLDLIHQVYPESPYHPIVAKFLYSGLKRTRHIIAISESSKEDLVDLYNIPASRVHVTYLAADKSTFKPIRLTPSHYERFGLEENMRYVLQLGSGTKRKNLHGFLQAIALMKKRNAARDTRFLVAGKFQYKSDRKRIHGLANSLGISDRVHFIGHISDTDLPILYNIADVFVFPSFYEGFGLPILEAMGCGTPVVTSNLSSMPEVAGTAAILVNPYSIKEISDAIASILADGNLAKQLEKKGIQRASEFSWEKTIRKTFDVYCQYSEVRRSE